MAYQKQTYQDGVTEYTDTLYQHMDDGIFGAYPVQLIAISDTAPSECVENDKYYNTSTKKIYTATGTNTWGTNGETPLEDTSYWLISENGNYAWDGTDLVSIGGGKAEVVISDEEPEEGKLWVDTAEIQTIAGRDRLVNVSTEVDEDYKVNFLKSKNLFDVNTMPLTNNLWTGGNSITTNAAGWYVVVPITGGKTYTISKKNAQNNKYVLFTCTTQTYPANGVSIVDAWGGSGTDTERTIQTSSSAKYLFIGLGINLSGDSEKASAIEELQVVEGSTALPYEPYITPSIYVDNEEIYNQNIMNYSTNEQVIGKWIDGKPIYRKSVSGTTATSGNRVELQTNVDKLIDYNVVVKNGTANQYHPVSFGMCSSQSTHANPIFLGGTTATTAYLYITTSAYTSQPFYGWIEYTKTTD